MLLNISKHCSQIQASIDMVIILVTEGLDQHGQLAYIDCLGLTPAEVKPLFCVVTCWAPVTSKNTDPLGN